jgi:hypothetical protein
MYQKTLTYSCLHTFSNACLHFYIDIFMYTCIYNYTCIHIYISARGTVTQIDDRDIFSRKSNSPSQNKRRSPIDMMSAGIHKCMYTFKFMYIHIYMYIYIYIYVLCIYIHVYLYVYMFIHIYTYIQICVYIYIHE